jgi:hypothetical protein
MQQCGVVSGFYGQREIEAPDMFSGAGRKLLDETPA